MTVDELIDTDRDELNRLKVATGLAITEEQQAKRAEMIEKIMYLQTYAVLEDDVKRDQWYGQKNDNGNGKPVKQSKFNCVRCTIRNYYYRKRIALRRDINKADLLWYV